MLRQQCGALAHQLMQVHPCTPACPGTSACMHASTHVKAKCGVQARQCTPACPGTSACMHASTHVKAKVRCPGTTVHPCMPACLEAEGMVRSQVESPNSHHV
eukprot:1162018-Pelagomonas_calceolata.AAC.11